VDNELFVRALMLKKGFRPKKGGLSEERRGGRGEEEASRKEKAVRQPSVSLRESPIGQHTRNGVEGRRELTRNKKWGGDKSETLNASSKAYLQGGNICSQRARQNPGGGGMAIRNRGGRVFERGT